MPLAMGSPLCGLERSIVQVCTGGGSGKTVTALGLGQRAAGHGFDVLGTPPRLDGVRKGRYDVVILDDITWRWICEKREEASCLQRTQWKS